MTQKRNLCIWDGTKNLLVDLSRDGAVWASGGGIYVRIGFDAVKTVDEDTKRFHIGKV